MNIVRELTESITYANHNTAELAFAFLVTSQPSSSPTGSIVKEPTPKITMIANNPPRL
jgi:hypothetical protein